MGARPGAAPVSGLDEVASIAPTRTKAAVLRNGRVMDWRGAAPTPISGLSDVRSVAEGDFCVVALLRSGAVVATGYNGHGCLGNPGYQSTSQFVPVLGVTRAVAIAVGGSSLSGEHGYGVLRNGTVMEWGGGQAEVPHRMAGCTTLSRSRWRRPDRWAWRCSRTIRDVLVVRQRLRWKCGRRTRRWHEHRPASWQVSGLSHATAIAAAGHHGSVEDSDVWGLAAWSRGHGRP